MNKKQFERDWEKFVLMLCISGLVALFWGILAMIIHPWLCIPVFIGVFFAAYFTMSLMSAASR